jgi:hypothetical protein
MSNQQHKNGTKTLLGRAYESTKRHVKNTILAGVLAAGISGCGRTDLDKLPPKNPTVVKFDAQPKPEPDAEAVVVPDAGPDVVAAKADTRPKPDAGADTFVKSDTQAVPDSGPDAVVVKTDVQPRQDSGTDVVVPADTQPKPDSGIDATRTDGANDALGSDAVPSCVPLQTPQPTQQPDGGGAVPVTYSYTVGSLIGDNIDRTLLDRGQGVSTYPMGSDTSAGANPFTDGTGTGSLGPTDTALYKADGTMFAPFATATVVDNDAAKTYQAEQGLWIGGNTHYSDAAAAVVGTLNSVSYTMKFSGASDGFGIPVCTTPMNSTNYMVCDPDYQTAMHKVVVPFLGDNWLITGMTPPSGPLASESTLASGGYVKLGKEIATGILNIGEAMLVDNLRFRIDGFNKDGTVAISIVDKDCNILKKDTLERGTTKEFNIKGTAYLLHLWKSAPGYTFGAQWVDLSVLSKEITLTSGEKLDAGSSANPNWTVYLGWKNRGASATDTNPDHLRTIILYAGDSEVAKLSSGGSSDLKTGDYLPIAQDPLSMQLQYKGLTDGKPSSLQFSLERSSNFTISAAQGPNGQSCTISAPYAHVVSGAQAPAFTVDGVQGAGSTTSASGNDFYIATSGASCGGSIGQLMQGSLFMKVSPSSSQWAYVDYAPFLNTDAVRVKFPLAGDGVSDEWVGNITYQYVRDFMPQIGDFEFEVGEEAGIGVSKSSPVFYTFGLKLDRTASTFNYDSAVDSTSYWVKKDTVSYCGAGPAQAPNSRASSASYGCVWPSTGSIFRAPGFADERGSQFVGISDTTVEFRIAGQLVQTQFYLAKK